VDSIEVRWSNGTIQRFGETAANAFVKIVEGKADLQVLGRAGK
jgi:hypothetical protein